MKKRGFKWIFYVLILFLFMFFLYNLNGAFNASDEENFIQSISISMLILFLIGIGSVVYYFFINSQELGKDRISGLIRKKVYTLDGEYFGVVSDVLVGENKIYGLKIISNIGKKKKKLIVLSRFVNNYGEVVLIDSNIKEKL